MGSKIEWTDETWNMIGGCTKASPGCGNCYALRDSWRIMHNPKAPARYDDVCGVGPDGVEWTGRINLDRKALDIPLRWKKPRRVFVASMADLFHTKMPWQFISDVFSVMARCQQHTFQVLTKRPAHLRDWQSWAGWLEPNVWLGTTIELPAFAHRAAVLQDTPAAIRFISFEPLLGYMGERPNIVLGMDWAIIGCESGPNRRPMRLEWALDLVRVCKASGVPVFVKQLDLDGKVSKDPDEWPEELRVREYPE